MKNYDVFVAGGGAAGITAAITAAASGATVLMADQGDRPGGILNRCVHHGFGLGSYREDLTGQEYASRIREDLANTGVTVCCRTTVLSLHPDRTAILSGPGELRTISFHKCILAAGSYERTPESLPLAGTRPAGVFTAGCAQELIHTQHRDIGNRIVILGSGDVGQILAGQLASAGKTILAMVEQRDHPGGLPRNHKKYLTACSIPLILNSTITRLHGAGRLQAVTIRHLPTGRETRLACDTLITALGLIPDCTLARPLMQDGRLPAWIIPVGNCERIYDIVDSIAAETRQQVAEFL